MAQDSWLWTTGATGDGAAAYTQAKVILWQRQTFIGADNEGVLKDYLNELVTTGATSPVATNTGGAYVHGFPYNNSASVDTAISTPSSNTRIDRLVLRANWSAQTVRITRIAGTEGTGNPPSIVQIDGTTWDIPLYQVSITTGGNITLTDEREFLHPNIGVNTDMLDADAVTPAKILNRTRKFFVPAVTGYNITDSTTISLERVTPPGDFGGLSLPDTKYVECFGHFFVPEDFVSGMTAVAVIIPGGTGNFYGANTAQYGACNAVYNTHTNAPANATEGVTQNHNECVRSLSIASAAIGDIVALTLLRRAENAQDTIDAAVSFFGWIVEYTADS